MKTKILLYICAFCISAALCYSEPASLVVSKDSTLAPGVVYKQYLYKTKRDKNLVHVIEADLLNPEVMIKVLKAGNNNSGLEKLQIMDSIYDATNPGPFLGGINANFWRAYGNYPIGPTIVEGEVIEMKRHKKWSAAFFDEFNRMYTDSFVLTGNIKIKNKNFSILNVNRRGDSLGIVVYNKFRGDSVPYFETKWIQKEIDSAWAELIKDMPNKDTTEWSYSYESLAQEMMEKRRQEKNEFRLKKIGLVYLDSMGVNKEVRAKVVFIQDSGVASIPQNGIVISVGDDMVEELKLNKGDIIKLEYSTNVHSDIVFMNSVAGTPRLVRDGKAGNEARIEGSNSRRFINHPLPRTGLGSDKLRRKVYFVAVEPTQRSKGIKGVNLARMAFIMKKIGAYNAINLDGGGSTIMTIDESNVLRPESPKGGRKISVGIGVALKNEPMSLKQAKK